MSFTDSEEQSPVESYGASPYALRGAQRMKSSIACQAIEREESRNERRREKVLYGLQGRYCFLGFFRQPDKCKNPDWSDLMNDLIHPSDWSATCHSKPIRSSHINILQGR